MESLIDFLLLRDSNVRFVVLGVVLLAASAAMVGTFTLLRKKSLAGDAVAHAILPGICLAFLLAGNKNPWLLVGGAFATGWLSLLSIDFIVARTRLREDAAISLTLSVFFGLGVLLLTAIQHSGNAAQAGLNSFLFGKAAALVGTDLLVFALVALLVAAALLLFYKEFKLMAFDEQYARVLGFPVRRLELLLTSLTVMAVVAGIQAVGVVLMAAMLITPGVAARFWTNRLGLMLVLAAAIGAASGVAGAFVSYTMPAMPTGPWIVLVASLVAIASFMFAPQKGLVAKMLRQRAYRQKFAQENILKLFYKLGEKTDDFGKAYTAQELLAVRPFAPALLRRTLHQLKAEGYLRRHGQAWQLSPEGKDRGQRITRLHRLWELYLTEYLRIAPDHVHDDAETMEHIITPEIEQMLEKRLQNPTHDPHQSRIPL